jgi:hypothetical protein
MPNVYREKTCPKCQKKHRKRGPFCSASCGNSDREPTEKQRENMRKVVNEFNKTPEAIAIKRMMATGITPDEFGVDIPTLSPDISDYNDYERGEDW